MPRYLIIDFSKAEKEAEASDDDALSVSKRFCSGIKRHTRCLLNDQDYKKAGSYAPQAVESDIILEIAAGSKECDDLLQWIIEHEK